MRKIKLELWVFGFGFWFCSERRVLGSPSKENAVILGTRIETLTNAAIFYFHRESYLMSNGIQAYENGDGACFLSSGALVHDSRDLFSEGRYSFICQSLESAPVLLSSRSLIQYAKYIFDIILCTHKYQKQSHAISTRICYQHSDLLGNFWSSIIVDERVARGGKQQSFGKEVLTIFI